MEVKVKLISWTQNPVETIYLLWKASRTEGSIFDVEELQVAMINDIALQNEVQETFKKVLVSKLPIAENISFVFLLENISVSFREQMVRHRIGTKVGERVGMDYFPDLHNSSWWSQSMRVQDMSDFAGNSKYHIPESIEKHPKALNIFQSMMHQIANTYSEMVAFGIPVEDAREILPLGAQHRISWSMNLSTFAHIFSTRSCWIAQLRLWQPVLSGMLEEVCNKVNPIFSVLATPPCMSDDKFKGCCYIPENMKRASEEDPNPPCALWMHTTPRITQHEQIEKRQDYLNMCEKYTKFWRRNVRTGKKI